MYGVRDELIEKINAQLLEWENIKSSELDKLNATVLENNIQLISIN